MRQPPCWHVEQLVTHAWQVSCTSITGRTRAVRRLSFLSALDADSRLIEVFKAVLHDLTALLRPIFEVADCTIFATGSRVVALAAGALSRCRDVVGVASEDDREANTLVNNVLGIGTWHTLLAGWLGPVHIQPHTRGIWLRWWSCKYRSRK